MKTKITINNKEYEIEVKDEDVKKIEQGTEISVPSKSKPKLRPAMGEEYWFLNTCSISSNHWDNYRADNDLWNSGNGFFTEEEAEKESAKRKAIRRVKDYIIENGLEAESDKEYRYLPCWEENNGCFSVTCYIGSIPYSPYGFLDSIETCEQLNKNCESDLKIILGVEEEE